MFAGEEEQMRWSFTLGRVGETVVRIHLTLVVLLAWYAWEGWRAAGFRGAVDQFLFIALLFLSVLLHEFGHIRAARRYGIPTPDVILTPIGGVARIARMPDKPMHELVIALAGPLVTLLIAAALAVGVTLTSGWQALTTASFAGYSLWAALCWTNVILLLFNLIPAFPMDGGRVLRALLATRIGMVRGTRIAARTGQVVAVVLAIVGLQYNIFLVLIAAFVFLGAEAEYEHVKTRDLAGDLTAGRLTVTDLRILSPSMRLDQAISLARSDGIRPRGTSHFRNGASGIDRHRCDRCAIPRCGCHAVRLQAGRTSGARRRRSVRGLDHSRQRHRRAARPADAATGTERLTAHRRV
jgi:stage IV sporulation protein FB